MISYEEYYPYGRSAYRTVGVDLSLKRYRFTGKERDEETGLDYFGVRYYASWLGRWTSGDPGGFVDGLNLYRYTRNNPVNGVDALGYSTDDPPPERHTGGYRIDFNQSNSFISNKSGLDEYSGDIDYNSSSTSYTVTPTSQKGLTFFYNTSLTTEDGTTTTSRQFYPHEHDAIVNSGITSTGDAWGWFSIDDSDLVSLAKLAPDELVDFLVEQDSYFRGNLKPIRSSYSFYERVSATAQTVELFAGFASLGKNMLRKIAKSSVAKGGITGMSDDVKGGVPSKLAKGVNPLGDDLNCVGCAEAMYRRLDGDYDAITNLNNADLGKEITTTRRNPNTGVEQVITYLEKTTPAEVAKYLGQKYERVSTGLTGSSGKPVNLFGTRAGAPNNIFDFMNKQPDGTHYIVTAGDITNGHAFNMAKTSSGIEMIDPQNGKVFSALLNRNGYNNYIKRNLHGTINLWTKK